jgi:hypothetical protein
MNAWKTAGCAECHGAFADGERQRDEAPAGANLRSARLDNAALTEVIRCGRASTGMPRFDEGAYTQRACYGQATGAVPEELAINFRSSAAVSSWMSIRWPPRLLPPAFTPRKNVRVLLRGPGGHLVQK